MAVDARFENAEHSVGVSMPWNPDARKPEDSKPRNLDEFYAMLRASASKLTDPSLPIELQWMAAYRAHVETKHQEKEKGK